MMKQSAFLSKPDTITALLGGILFLILSPQLAQAERALRTNGFITATFSQVDSEVPFMGGLNDEINFSQGSLIGLQTTFQPSEDPIEFVVQLLALGKEQWEVDAEWAYVAYRPTDAWELKLGRYRIPFFHVSEFLHVGIAYPWVRPPEEIHFVPFTALNGASVKRSGHFGDLEMAVQMYSGELKDLNTQIAGLTLTTDRFESHGIVLSAETDSTNVRASFHKIQKIGITINSLAAANPNLDFASLLAFASSQGLNPGDFEDVDVITFSVLHRRDNFEFRGEWAEEDFNENAPLPDAYAYYVMLGYYMGNFMPHLTYSAYDTKEKGLANLGQESIIAGLRVNVNPAVAVKVEVGQMRLDDAVGTVGFYDTLPSSITGTAILDEEVNIFNASINMVF